MSLEGEKFAYLPESRFVFKAAS